VRGRGAALAAFLLLVAAPRFADAGSAPPDSLSFETPGSTDSPPDWPVPKRTVFRDSTVSHSGRYSARIERDSLSGGDFSSIEKLLPVTFVGDTVELRGWLKLDGVSGSAGLWMRLDARDRPVQFENMEDRHLSGTSPWTEYRVSLPLDKRARRIAFGVLLVGAGALHADDLQLLLDGKPLAEAPTVVQEPMGVEIDHEFDGGSQVTAGRVSAAQVENLVLLAKVWGFLKYHHPRVTAGTLHWDYELFRVLPSVLRAENRAQAAESISTWLARIGDPAPCGPCATLPDSGYLMPRVEWIHDRARLGPALSERLERAYAGRPADGDQYYAGFQQRANPDFSSEAEYADRAYPDPGYRLLSLFRYWNIVEYWFPDRDLIRENWDGVLAEFIPRVLSAASADEYRLAMLAFAARLRDGHASVWNMIGVRPPRGGCGLPIAVRPVEGRYVVAAYADSARARASGFEVGDVIRAIDGTPVDSLAASWAEYYGVSNDSALKRQIGLALPKGPCGPCSITVDRHGRHFEISAVRDSITRMDGMAGYTHDLPGEAFRLLSKDVAYLKLSGISQKEIPSYIERAAGTRCFVIDIRNYPKEAVPFALGRHLVDRPTPFARFTHGDPSNPGAFQWTGPVVIKPEAPHYAGAVVVLVDDASISAAEYTAMALRAAPGAIVVGSTTAGADGNLSSIPLPGGLRAAMSGLGVFYPDKRPTQQIGIVPDLEVRPTIRGIREGRDEVLEAALKKAPGRDVKVPLRP
jgi:C-terminal processing protease CtpA/Prc